MFYFGHPFGIQTPSGVGGCGGSTTITNASTPTCEFYFGGRDRYNLRRKNTIPQHQSQQKIQQQQKVNKNDNGGSNGRRRASLVPWPRNTWSRDSALPPLLQILARQYGKWCVFNKMFLSKFYSILLYTYIKYKHDEKCDDKNEHNSVILYRTGGIA